MPGTSLYPPLAHCSCQLCSCRADERGLNLQFYYSADSAPKKQHRPAMTAACAPIVEDACTSGQRYDQSCAHTAAGLVCEDHKGVAGKVPPSIRPTSAQEGVGGASSHNSFSLALPCPASATASLKSALMELEPGLTVPSEQQAHAG